MGFLQRNDPQALESRQKLCAICEAFLNSPKEPPKRAEPPMTLSEVFKKWKGE